MHNNFYYHQEILRKFIHIFSSVIPLSILYYGSNIILPYLIIIAFIFIVFDYSRLQFSIINKYYTKYFGIFTRPSEERRLSGASWLLFSACITVLIFEENIAIISLLVLSIADAFAAIIGIKYGKTKLFKKSLEGTISYFLAASCIIILFADDNFIVNLSASIISSACELLSVSYLNDNLLIPLVTGFILSLGAII